MMQIEINEQTVDRQLVDAGIGKDAEEQAVRPMFFHLFCAIRYYRDMTYAEKIKAGFLYRTKFKNVYSLTGFFKERKRNRDKKSSPLHPSYKEESGVLGKDYDSLLPLSGGKYDRQMVLKFFYYWAQEVKKTGTMRWENETAWTTEFALAGWSKKPFETYAQAANIRLERTKGRKASAGRVLGGSSAEEQALAAEREAANARREQELAEAKAGAVSYEEYLNLKH